MDKKPSRASCLKTFQVLRLKSVIAKAVSFRDVAIKLLCMTLFFPFSVSAQEHCASLWNNEIKMSYGVSGFRDLSLRSQKLQILVWNIHKAADPKMTEEYKFMSKFSDIVLFQESISDRKFISSIVDADTNIGWSQTKAYRNSRGLYAGVATGSRVMPLSETPVLSKVTEPILNSPKSFMLTEYLIQGRNETLLVANMHAINFVTNSTYREHIDQLVSHIRDHQGPLLVAGDFNTWNYGRTEYLLSKMADLGLREIKVPQRGMLTLDHIFVRGLLSDGVRDMTFVKSSDHSPLLVDLIIPGV